jgi:hypothetical protein
VLEILYLEPATAVSAQSQREAREDRGESERSIGGIPDEEQWLSAFKRRGYARTASRGRLDPYRNPASDTKAAATRLIIR